MHKIFFACFLGSFIGQIFAEEFKGFMRGLKKMNNYEKIKNMSIEKMAEFIPRSICLSCIHLNKHRNCEDLNCQDGIKQWLKQEEE